MNIQSQQVQQQPQQYQYPSLEGEPVKNLGEQQPVMVQPPLGYPPQPVYTQPQQQFITGQPVMPQSVNPQVVDQQYTRVPVLRVSEKLQCKNCFRIITTQVKYGPGPGAFIIGLVLFFCGCWLCCWIPCVLDDCQDAHHYCPVCQNELGTEKYLFS